MPLETTEPIAGRVRQARDECERRADGALCWLQGRPQPDQKYLLHMPNFLAGVSLESAEIQDGQNHFECHPGEALEARERSHSAKEDRILYTKFSSFLT